LNEADLVMSRFALPSPVTFRAMQCGEANACYSPSFFRFGASLTPPSATLLIAGSVSVDTGENDQNGRPILAPKHTGLYWLRHWFASRCLNRKEEGGHDFREP